MASTIKLKNGSGAPLASDLVAGEPALDLTNKRLYTEDSGGTVIEVGTNPSTITIPGGTIDNTVIGGTTTAAGSFTTLQADTSLNVDGTVTADGLTVDGDGSVNGTLTISGTAEGIRFSETDTTDENNYITTSAGDFLIRTANDAFNSYTTRFRIDNATGDISFYEDTGATAKFFWDASQESLTLGASAEPAVAAGNLNLVGDSTTNDTAQASLSFYDGGSNDLATIKSYRGGTFSDGELAFEVAQGGSSPVEAMRITSIGRVGIGTNDPSEQLEIFTSVNETPATLSLHSGDTSIAGTQEIGAIYGKGTDSGGSAPYTGAKITFAADGTWDTGTIYYYPTAIKFYTQQASGTDNIAAGPRMTITSSGNVGIGTGSDAPQKKLDVRGELAISNSTTSYWNINRDDTDGSLTFTDTDVSERLRIDSSGNLGLDVTPSAWAANYRVFDLNHGGLSQGGSGAGSVIDLSYNCYFNGTNWIYKNSDEASHYRQAGGNHFWFNAPSGTASNAITFTQAMTLNTSGDLLVGTTDTAVNDNSTASSASNGHNIRADGKVDHARYTTTTAAPVLGLNRVGSDGYLAEFRKDGASVGSIGVDFGDNLTIDAGAGESGLNFATSQLAPYRGGANADAAIDLGLSSVRWKDLYLSGGVVLDDNPTAVGGSVTSKTLDDYEEGTFTPELADASTGGNVASSTDQGYYTKIGNLVYITALCRDIDTTGLTAGNTLYFRGLPFTAANQGELTVRFDRITFSGKFVTLSHSAATYARFFETVSNAQDAALTVAAVDGTGSDIFVSGCFRV